MATNNKWSVMILGALRYTRRGWTFDDLEETTGISEETLRQFYHKFITVGSTILFKKYVVEPTRKRNSTCMKWSRPGSIALLDWKMQSSTGKRPLGRENETYCARTSTIKCKGVWLIVDHGYLRWSVTVPPLKVSQGRRVLLWPLENTEVRFLHPSCWRKL